ncbi:thrombospondin type-1 domain-containing protein [Candidatus Daviesbacteria bacterium]|nr:thrombospondin type-1 domain-containing protein [Candidatus Daviesbacteria bacterium]
MNNIKEKLIDVRNLLQGHILVLIIILVVVIGIPVTFYLAKQQQDLRSKATDAGSLVFIPPTPTGSVNINSVFDLEFGINLNPAARITGVDVTITYANNLRLDTFSKDTTVLPELVLESRNPAVNPITVHYVAVSKTGDLVSRTYVPLGKLTFTAISAGTATITITTNQIVAKDQAGTVAIGGTTTTTYTIAGPTNGTWSAWSGGTCTVTCGGGTLTGETRTCSAPAPGAGGTECTKLDGTLTTATNRTETRSAVTACNTQACAGCDTCGTAAADVCTTATACGTNLTGTCNKTTLSTGGTCTTVTGASCTVASKTCATAEYICSATNTCIPPCINGDTIGGNLCVSIDDYNTWYSEFVGAVTTETADFYPECNNNQKGDGVIDIKDYNIWRREFDAGLNLCP